MTPKEKAEQLVVQHYGHSITIERAKNSAIISAGIVTSSLESLYNDLTLSDTDSLKIKFEIICWKQIRKEIEKL